MSSEPANPIHTLYQPIVSVTTHKILGYEALTRGKGNFSQPEKLFRHSYRRGTTAQLDFQCLKEAFRILPKLKAGELLFVNIEPITLCQCFMKGGDADFLLKKLFVFHRKIVFELTEGMKARDFEYVKKGVLFIRTLGAGFAIDDVAGIGIKLLNLLSLKPQYLKIDISLIRGLGKNPTYQRLVRRLVAMAKKQKCLLVAEGVEERKDLKFVREMGIHYAQGFYFSRPRKQLFKTTGFQK